MRTKKRRDRSYWNDYITLINATRCHGIGWRFAIRGGVGEVARHSKTLILATSYSFCRLTCRTTLSSMNFVIWLNLIMVPAFGNWYHNVLRRMLSTFVSFGKSTQQRVVVLPRFGQYKASVPRMPQRQGCHTPVWRPCHNSCFNLACVVRLVVVVLIETLA